MNKMNISEEKKSDEFQLNPPPCVTSMEIDGTGQGSSTESSSSSSSSNELSLDDADHSDTTVYIYVRHVDSSHAFRIPLEFAGKLSEWFAKTFTPEDINVYKNPANPFIIEKRNDGGTRSLDLVAFNAIMSYMLAWYQVTVSTVTNAKNKVLTVEDEGMYITENIEELSKSINMADFSKPELRAKMRIPLFELSKNLSGNVDNDWMVSYLDILDKARETDKIYLKACELHLKKVHDYNAPFKQRAIDEKKPEDEYPQIIDLDTIDVLHKSVWYMINFNNLEFATEYFMMKSVSAPKGDKDTKSIPPFMHKQALMIVQFVLEPIEYEQLHTHELHGVKYFADIYQELQRTEGGRPNFRYQEYKWE